MRFFDCTASAAGLPPSGLALPGPARPGLLSSFAAKARRRSLVALTALLPLAAMAQNAANPPRLAADYGKLPLSFEANQGQTDSQVKFLSRGNGYSLFLTDKAAVLALTKAAPAFANKPAPLGKAAAKPAAPAKTDVVRMELAGASLATKVEGDEPLPGTANYFIGNDPSKWHTNVPTFAKVKYAGVYPGVDLVYYGNQRQLEYDFMVAPGANPKSVKLHFAGAEKLRLTPDGDLTVVAKNGEIAFHKPVVYQDGVLPLKPTEGLNGAPDRQRKMVDGRFVLLAGNSVGFAVGNYDRGRELVIDPTLAYSTYLGGSGGDSGVSVAVDASGNAYVTGTTSSSDFPATSGAYQRSYPGQALSQTSIYVTKINSAGNGLVYSTYIGGGLTDPSADSGGLGDASTAIKVDTEGNAYICGGTSSVDFPITPGAFQTVNQMALNNNLASPFITKLNATGAQLVYSTFVGGSGNGNSDESASGIGIDTEGDAYITGTTFSSDFPVKNPYQGPYNVATYGVGNAFVTKLNPTGSDLVYSTYLGGNGVTTTGASGGGDVGVAIAIDSSGDAFVAGDASSTDFPTSATAYQRAIHAKAGEFFNVFVTKFDPTGTKLLYSTFLGGTTMDVAAGIAVDSSGSAYMTGNAYSEDFPLSSKPFQSSNKAYRAFNPFYESTNAFVTKLNTSGSALSYSTYLGGSGTTYSLYYGTVFYADSAAGIAVDSLGDAYVTGTTYSTDFPVFGAAFQPKNEAGGNTSNAFLSELNPSGNSLIYSTYFGGSGEYFSGEEFGPLLVELYFGDSASGLAVDDSGGIYLTGTVFSTDFPISTGAYQISDRSAPGGSNAFVSKFYSGEAATLTNSTTTTLTSSAYLQTAGKQVTFTAFVQNRSGKDVTVGTVDFMIDNETFAVPLDSTGHATYSTSSLTCGDYSVTAFYTGTSTYLPSADGSLSEEINPATNISISIVSGSGQSSPVGVPYPSPLVVKVEGSSGLPLANASVIYESGEALVHVLTGSNGEASLVTAPTMVGSDPVFAEVVYTLGDALPASVTFALTGTAARTATTTTLTSSLNPASIGQSVKFTATVKAASGATPAGSVTFTHDGTAYPAVALSGGVATYTTSTLPVGVHKIVANYSGSSTDSASTSTALSEAINGEAATPTFTPAAGTYSGAQKVTLADTTAGAAIYFTLNGTTPTTSSTKYTSPISVGVTEAIKAIAVATGYANSAVATATYIIK